MYTYTGYFANMDWEPANLFYLQCLCEVYNILLNDPKGIHILHTIHFIYCTHTIYTRVIRLLGSYVHIICTQYVHSLIHTLLSKSCNY